MDEKKSKEFPVFSSLDELVEFFDTHNLGDYWDSMPEAHFEIGPLRSWYMVAIASDLASELTKIAKQNHTSTEALVDSWLRERLEQAS